MSALVALGSIARSTILPRTPSTAATALEPKTRCSKLLEVDVKEDAELLIAPYKAEPSRISNLLYVQRKSSPTCY
jgi:hypothetical protein